MQILLVDPQNTLPAETAAFLQSKGFGVQHSENYDTALPHARSGAFEALIVPAPENVSEAAAPAFSELMRTVDLHGMAAIVLANDHPELDTVRSRLVHWADPRASVDEIQGRLSTIRHYHGVVRAMERDLDNMQRLFRRLNVQFTEVDQETRLAGRLQAEFLPKHFENIGPLHFATLYRPATFVSGDIYDIYRVDEDQVAFYVADAVGHGMAASLLTMFIKNAVVSKRIEQDSYEILEPGETLAILNQKLRDQHLPNSQFVTACYGVFNMKTYELRYARAGHPYPLICDAEGSMTELKSSGGLLGLFEDEDYPTHTIRMQPGEKLIFYSDGLELAFAPAADRKNAMSYYRNALKSVIHLPPEEMVEAFAHLLDEEAGSLNPQDDVTILILQVD